jgi:hypothetical protein
MRLITVLLAPILLTACAATPESKVSIADQHAFAAAVARMCDVDRQAGISPDADPLGAGPKRTAWIAANVDNPDAIELRTLMSVKGASEQATMLRDRAKELGLRTCALAEALTRTGEGGLSP